MTISSGPSWQPAVRSAITVRPVSTQPGHRPAHCAISGSDVQRRWAPTALPPRRLFGRTAARFEKRTYRLPDRCATTVAKNSRRWPRHSPSVGGSGKPGAGLWKDVRIVVTDLAIVTTTSRKRVKVLRAERAPADGDPELRAWLERAKWGRRKAGFRSLGPWDWWCQPMRR